MKITFGEEVVISRGSEETNDWGPWQFPILYRCRNRWYVEFNRGQDHVTDCALPKKQYVSTDDGESWAESSDYCGLELENGEIIRPHVKEPVPEEEASLPGKIGSIISYGLEFKIYDMAEVDEKYRKWYIDRYNPLTKNVSTEEVK